MSEIIGQDRVVEELNLLFKDVLKNDKNYNVLLRAPSGYGKTAIAFNLMSWFKPNDRFYQLGSTAILDYRRLQIIDEAHMVKEPEIFYPIMDCGKISFLLLTNLSGELKEAFRNRCIEFIFDPYTEDELKAIAKLNLSDFELNNAQISSLVTRCKKTPREIKVVCQRLSYIFRSMYIPQTEAELNEILENVLSLHPGGLTKKDQIYLDFLSKATRASLKTISAATGLDEETIKFEIEPGLLYLGKIKITSKGRQIC